LHSDTTEYEHRALGIINQCNPILYKISDTVVIAEPGKRPVPDLVVDFDMDVGLDDVLARVLLPLMLGYWLFVDENPSLAAAFLASHNAQYKLLAAGGPASFDSITDVYGMATEYNQFSSW